MSELEWLAATTGIIGAMLLAVNVSVSRYGFLFFLCSSLTWAWLAYQTEQPALLTNQMAFVVINLVGVKRWLVRSRDGAARQIDT